jgi:hypothetical protein
MAGEGGRRGEGRRRGSFAGIAAGAVSDFRFLDGLEDGGFGAVRIKLELEALVGGSSLGLVKRFLKLVPISPSLRAACWASAAAIAACSRANNSFLSFLASFNFMPLLLSLDSYPRESALISPGTNCFPGAVVAMLSQSRKSSPVSSAFARVLR